MKEYNYNKSNRENYCQENSNKNNNNGLHFKNINEKKTQLLMSFGSILRTAKTSIGFTRSGCNENKYKNKIKEKKALYKFKELLTARNQINTFKSNNNKEELFGLNELDCNTKKHYILKGKVNKNNNNHNNKTNELKFTYSQYEIEKPSSHFFKLKINKYTNEIDKRHHDKIKIKEKLRQSSSACQLRENNQNESNKNSLIHNISTLNNNVINPSLAKFPLSKLQCTKIQQNEKENRRVNIFKGFGLETPGIDYKKFHHSKILRSLLENINMESTTRNNNINSSNQGLILKTNIELINKKLLN